MFEYAYLLFNLCIFVAGMVFFRISKNPPSVRGFFNAYLMVSLPFIIWDSWAVSQGHWSFNPDYIIGLYIGNLAVEEVLFFITVPFAMASVYSLVVSRPLRQYPDRVAYWYLVSLLITGSAFSARAVSSSG